MHLLAAAVAQPEQDALCRKALYIKILCMTWINLIDEVQLQEIKEKSNSRPQLIFKHSTRCGISSMAKARLDRSHAPHGIDYYFLDLIKHRNISNKISSDFKVHHQSPQVLIIKDGESIYDESHAAIDMQEIATYALRA